VAILAAKARRGPATASSVAFAVLLYVLSIGPIANSLAIPLEDRYPPLADASGARAVVVLGGGHIDGSPGAGGASELGRGSTMRALRGLRLALDLDLPLLYSGGSPLSPKGSAPEAEIAADFLVSMGLPKERIIEEGASRDTFENALLTAKALEDAGIGKGAEADAPVILVTSALHMPRSAQAFEKAGLRIIAAPADYRVDRNALTAADFLPSAGALELSFDSLHEYVGLAYYSLRRR
jgi:uncharacterized SAM-binding protein YcdF (DUF218 family)